MAFAQHHHDLVAGDQAFEAGSRLVHGGRVFENNLKFFAENAALGVDVLGGQLDALVKRLPGGRGGSGAGADDADLDGILRPGAAAEQQQGNGYRNDPSIQLHEQPPFR